MSRCCYCCYYDTGLLYRLNHISTYSLYAYHSLFNYHPSIYLPDIPGFGRRLGKKGLHLLIPVKSSGPEFHPNPTPTIIKYIKTGFWRITKCRLLHLLLFHLNIWTMKYGFLSEKCF